MNEEQNHHRRSQMSDEQLHAELMTLQDWFNDEGRIQDANLIEVASKRIDDLTKQLAEKDRLLADPTLGRLVPIDVQAALDAAIQDSEDVDANT